MNLRKLALAAAISLVTGNASAGALYAVEDSTRNLISIDSNTLAVTTIGSTGIATGAFGDMAYDPTSGTMYWVAGRGNNSLYTLNLATGAATLIGAHGIDDEFTLGWNGSGLYGQSTSGSVYSINTATAAATLIGSNGVYPGGYDYNTTTGEMILSRAGGEEFYSVNLGTGAATLLFSGVGNLNDNDLAYDADSNSYWVYDYNGRLYQYNATTFSSVVALTGLGVGASLEYVSDNVVDEPGTLALGLLGMVAFLARRKRALRA